MPHIPSFIVAPFLCALVIAVTLSLYSFIVVVKRWAFLSVGVSHAAFGGVALGFLLGIPVGVSASAFALAAAFLMGHMKSKGNIHEDVATGVIFSVFMALGVVLFSIREGYISDVFSYLFGSMLAVGWREVFVALTLSALSIGFLLAFKRDIFLMLVDPEMAYVMGVPVRRTYNLLLALFTLNVVVAIKLIGVILVSALTVVPASVAIFFFSKLKHIMLLSVTVGVLAVMAGMITSYITDLPPGATTALTAGALFFGALLISKR